MSSEQKEEIEQASRNQWSIRDQLCLASCVLKLDEQDWNSISQKIKSFVDKANLKSSSCYSHEACEHQYNDLLQSINSKIKKKKNYGESASDFIVRKLSQDRIAELAKILLSLKEEYYFLKSEINTLQNENISHEKLRKNWKAIQTSKDESTKSKFPNLTCEKEHCHHLTETNEISCGCKSLNLSNKDPTSELTNSFCSDVKTSQINESTTTNINESLNDDLANISNLNDEKNADNSPQIVSIPEQPTSNKSESIKLHTIPLTKEDNQIQIEEQIQTPVSNAINSEKIKDDLSEIIDDIEELIHEEIATVPQIAKNSTNLTNNSSKCSIPSLKIEIENSNDSLSHSDSAVSEMAIEDIDSSSPNIAEIIGTSIQTTKSNLISMPIDACDKTKETDCSETSTETSNKNDGFTSMEKCLDTECISLPPEKSCNEKEKEEDPNIKATNENISTKFETHNLIANDGKKLVESETSSKFQQEKINTEKVEVKSPIKIYDEHTKLSITTTSSSAVTASSSETTLADTISSNLISNEIIAEKSLNDFKSPSKDCHSTENKDLSHTIKTQVMQPIIVQTKPSAEICEKRSRENSTDSSISNSNKNKKSLLVKDSESFSNYKSPNKYEINIFQEQKSSKNFDSEKNEQNNSKDISEEIEEEPIMSKYSGTKAMKTYSKKQNTILENETENENSGETPDYRAWKKSILLVYNRLATHKYASLFLRPITDDQAPGYHSIIYRPMDLHTLKKNIDNGSIRCTTHFQRDVMLMFQNAIMFNKQNTSVHKMSLEMQEECLQHMQILLQATEDAPFRRETRTATITNDGIDNNLKRKWPFTPTWTADFENSRSKKSKKLEYE
ncbi:uncharacterized protein LOC106651407 isoform X2 [Trichogramma pretiosum]|uniref:uncharacterized protein LOC106651407 isoform X2 n=1 Tax=Trichogramma pretiosum TaxID=7493 RepID=UPI000C719E11|nr:uncharacterized protein LOC106651407 isoform X2 [Trichogramma pretiosum]